jgi:hypothetical protein
MKTILHLTTAAALLGTTASMSRACDVCGCYLTPDAHVTADTRSAMKPGWFVATSAQYTYFGTMQYEGHEVSNPTNQHENSTIQQTVIGYSFTDRLSAQVNIPLIYRSYHRPDGFKMENGTESGFGDLSLLGRAQVMRRDSEPSTFAWNIMAGLKFPTGNSRRIAEELHEEEIEGAPESGIHGHDLALGSGSWDVLTGTDFYWRWHRAFLTGSIQYAIRSEGDYDYRYANDLSWEAGPGCYFLYGNHHTLALQAIVSGEHKGTDTFQGESAEDTGITGVYLGPRLTVTWSSHLSAEIEADFPVHLDNTALQAVPDYRLRAGITWRF